MFLLAPGLKFALMAVTAVGVGAAVVTHWDDIRFIVEHFEEVKEEARQTLNRMQKQKIAVDEYREREGSPVPDISYSNDYEDAAYDSDATTRGVLRHRNNHHADESDSFESFPRSRSASLSSSSDVVDSSQLSMPSNHNITEAIPDLLSDTDSPDGMSDFSIISSDGEWSDGGVWQRSN